MVKQFNSLPYNPDKFNNTEERASENNMEKGENTGYQLIGIFNPRISEIQHIVVLYSCKMYVSVGYTGISMSVRPSRCPCVPLCVCLYKILIIMYHKLLQFCFSFIFCTLH